MTESEFHSIINILSSKGIHISLETDKEGNLWYDLNTGMKSSLKVALLHNGDAAWEGRYSNGTFEDYDELVFKVIKCFCGRDYANQGWFDLLSSDFPDYELYK